MVKVNRADSGEAVAPSVVPGVVASCEAAADLSSLNLGRRTGAREWRR
jgi:hypothetical protein